MEYKADNSPVSEADKRSHAILTQGLKAAFPDLPIISEEGSAADYEQRRHWRRFLLVDPLDGTKDFLAGHDEFVICIGLIEDHQPIWGAIHAPARGDFYYGGPGYGAFKEHHSGPPQPIRTAKHHPGPPLILHSRSHTTPKLDAWLQNTPHQRQAVGSGLKFALLAEGQGHIYPCLHPTYEWDTAAGHSIILAAGGSLLTTSDQPLTYNKPSLLNPTFVARA